MGINALVLMPVMVSRMEHELKQHYHVGVGSTGYGPDGLGAAHETLPDAIEAVRELIDGQIQHLADRARDLRQRADYAADDAKEADFADGSMSAGFVLYREAFEYLDAVEGLETLTASLSPERAEAPLYRGNPDMWLKELTRLFRGSFPVRLPGDQSLYLWDCRDDCDLEA